MKRSPLTRKRPLKAANPAAKGTVAPKHGKAHRSPLRPKPRKQSERERIYGPTGFLDWLHKLPCLVCGHRGDIHAHHTPHPSSGMGRRADWVALVPICSAHHRMIHDIGQKRVAAMAGLDWARAAARVQAAWEAANDT